MGDKCNNPAGTGPNPFPRISINNNRFSNSNSPMGRFAREKSRADGFLLSRRRNANSK
jgi:hypothetical protein